MTHRPVIQAERLGSLEPQVREAEAELERTRAIARLNERDASLWKDDPVHV